MTPYAPRHCRPEAFAKLASQLDDIDSTAGLVRGAVAIASHELPHADALAAEAQFDRIADRVRERVRRPDFNALLAHAHQVLFEEEGFTGDTENYYSRQNSYLPQVLESRKGIPIMLALVYKAVLERLGLRVVGINAPRHFLAGVLILPPGAPAEAEPGRPAPFGFAAGKEASPEAPAEAPEVMIVDPFFGGRVLTAAEALEQVEAFNGAAGTPNPLARATHRQWLARITRNLEMLFAHDGRHADVSAMIEMRRLLDVAEA